MLPEPLKIFFSQITIDEYAYTAYPERTKFSIAHEVGHLVLHADWYKIHGPKTMDDYLTFYDRIDHEIYKYLEIQASTFAGLILVPKEILLEKLGQRWVTGKKKLPRHTFEEPMIYLPTY